jgi:hypothetical protein
VLTPATCTSSAADAVSAACSALKNGSPKPISISRLGDAAGSWRKVRNAAADGTTVTAWLRASHGTPR